MDEASDSATEAGPESYRKLTAWPLPFNAAA
jgi:hypothetical protein